VTNEVETLRHAARMLRKLIDIRRAYAGPQGWTSVGLLLSTVDETEVFEVAKWIDDLAKDRSGTDSAQLIAGSEGELRAPPPPPASVTSPVEPLVAGTSAPYDWETEGLGGT